MKALRHIAPYVLIAAYMPLLVALSCHTHKDVHSLSECSECAHHLHHRAHLDDAAAMAHDCVYCQLTSSYYYCNDAVSLHIGNDIVTAVENAACADAAPVAMCAATPRAPPLQ